MLLQTDPGLAERTGFSTAQLETLTRSVERKKQKLEGDINDYIRRKQEELRSYEREVPHAVIAPDILNHDANWLSS